MFKNIKLHSKLLMIMFIPILALIASSIISAFHLKSISEALITSLYEENYQFSSYILNADRDLYQARDALTKMTMATTHYADQEMLVSIFEENHVQIQERVSNAERLVMANKGELNILQHEKSGWNVHDNFRSFHENYSKWVESLDSMNKRVLTGQISQDQVPSETKKADPFFETAREALNELGELMEEYAKDQISSKQAEIERYELYLALFNGLILLLSLSLGLLLIRSITIPLKRGINEPLKTIATGDFRIKLNEDRRDEIGDISRELSTSLKQISSLIQSISQSAELVNNASQEISSANQDLSQRTQEQAATLEEISSTMEEVAISIQQVSDISGQADEISRTTLEAVYEGEASIKATMKAMEEISTSSNRIAEIIKVVNDIAFQTNLLALNAAVEAARAGKEGRGFAVVAAEVRNLAGRTGESAKEIEKLISDSVHKVKKGGELAQKSSNLLDEIVSNTKHTADAVLEVAAAMREQSGASQQVQASIEQLNNVTQQNAAMVLEITSSSQAMNAEALHLQNKVQQFKVH